MKNTLIALIVLAAIGIGAYVFLKEKSNTPAGTALMQSETSNVSLPGETELMSAPAETISFFYVVGKDIQDAQAKITAYFDKIRATTVWKTLGVDAQIESMQQQMLGDTKAQQEALTAISAILKEGVNHGVGNLQYKDSVATLTSVLSFKNDQQPKRFLAALAPVLKADDAVVTLSESDLTVKFGQAADAATLVSKAEGSNLTSRFEVKGVTLPEGKTLPALMSSSERKDLLQHAALERTSGYIVGDQSALSLVLPKLAEKLSQSSFPALSAFPLMTNQGEGAGEWKTVASTFSLSPALRMKSCGHEIAPLPDTVPGRSYVSSGIALVGQRSPIVFSASADTVLRYLQKALSTTQSPDPKKAEEAKKDFDAVKDGIERLTIREVAVVTSIPLSGMTPEYGILFNTELPITTKDFAQQLSKGLETLKARYPTAELPLITQSSPTTIGLDLGNGTVLEGRNLSERALLFTSAPVMFEEVANTLKREKPFVSAERISASGMSDLVSQSSIFAYVSTSSLMPLAKQFAPFLSLLNPEAKLTDQDYTALLSLLEFSAVYAEASTPAHQGISCSVSGIGLLDTTPAT